MTIGCCSVLRLKFTVSEINDTSRRMTFPRKKKLYAWKKTYTVKQPHNKVMQRVGVPVKRQVKYYNKFLRDVEYTTIQTTQKPGVGFHSKFRQVRQTDRSTEYIHSFIHSYDCVFVFDVHQVPLYTIPNNTKYFDRRGRSLNSNVLLVFRCLTESKQNIKKKSLGKFYRTISEKPYVCPSLRHD